MRFVALPVEVDAVQWLGNLRDIPASWRDAETFSVEEESGDLIVATPEGPSHAKLGAWVVRGTEGEYYPVPHQVFYRKYRPVRGAGQPLALRLAAHLLSRHGGAR